MGGGATTAHPGCSICNGGCQRHAELAGHGVTHLGGHGPHIPWSPLPLIPLPSSSSHLGRGEDVAWVVVAVVPVAWSLSSSGWRGGSRVVALGLLWWSLRGRGGP